MLEWQGIEFRILKLKLHSCTAYRVVCAGVGSRHGYRLSYAFQGIGPRVVCGAGRPPRPPARPPARPPDTLDRPSRPPDKGQTGID
jgi:hypothetical protein